VSEFFFNCEILLLESGYFKVEISGVENHQEVTWKNLVIQFCDSWNFSIHRQLKQDSFKNKC